MAKATIVRCWAVLAAFVFVGCGTGSSTCSTRSCYPPGTYIIPNDDLGVTSAEICFDSDCTNVEALAGPDDFFNGFNVDTWQEGRTVEVRLTVFDGDANVIDSITEQRTMDSSRCACGVLFYDWKASRLHRLN